MDFRRTVRTIALIAATLVVGSPSRAQSLIWTAHEDNGMAVPFTQTLSPGLAPGADGSVFASSTAFNGAYTGLLTKYRADGAVLNAELERIGGPLAVVADTQGRPAVLTQWQTIGYDTAGHERWRADHTTVDESLQGTAMAAAPGDGFYVAGTAWPAVDGPPKLGVLRLDPSGRVAWRLSHWFAGSASTTVDSMGVDAAGRGYVVGRASFTAPDKTTHFVAAFGPDGSLLWSRQLEAPTMDPGRPLIQAVDPRGGVLVSWPGAFLEDFRLRGLDLSGETAWETISIVTSVGESVPRFMAATSDGGVVVAGDVGGAADAVIVAGHDAAGRQRWGVNAGAGWVGGLVMDTAGRAVVEMSEAATLRIKAYDPSGGMAWSWEQSGTPWTKWATAVGLLATPTGRVLALVDGFDGSITTQFTLAFEPDGHLDFASSPPAIPIADWARAAQFDPGGNAHLLTTHFNHGYRDLISKYDPAGLRLWSREVFVGDPLLPVAAMAVGPSGETVAVGSFDGLAPGVMPEVAKLDAAGTVVWRRSDFLVAPYDMGGATSVLVDAQGSTYVAGWVWDLDTGDSRLVLCKYSTDGQLLWRHYDSHPQAFTATVVRLTAVAGNRVAMAGTAFVPKDGTSEIRVAVVDIATGEEVWSGFATGPISSSYVRTVVGDSTGAVMVGTEFPGRLYRFGPTGAPEWSIVSPDGYHGQVNAVSVDGGNEVTVAFAAPTCHLVRLTPAGNVTWDRIVDFNGYCGALASRPSGGFVTVGSFFDPLDRSYHGYLAAFDALGHSEWSRETGKQRSGQGALDFVDVDGSGRVLAAGYDFDVATDYDALALVVSDDPKPPAASFFTVAPCRVADTRDPAPGGPAPLPAGSQMDVSVAGRCGIPATARAVALNLTAVSPDSAGYFTAFPTGRMPPTASLLNHGTGSTRASQAVLGLGDDGKLSLRAFQPSGGVHLLIDVAGYFE